MSTAISIGRRTVSKDSFITAINTSKTLDEVCRYLGFNETVGTTRKAIRAVIEELGLSVEHFDRKLPTCDSENFKAAIQRQVKQFNLSADNQQYYEAFEKTIAEGSWATYKASIGNLLDQLGQRDLAEIDVDTLITYCEGKKNREAHIRSILVYIISNNINNAKDKSSKDLLVWLITTGRKGK